MRFRSWVGWMGVASIAALAVSMVLPAPALAAQTVQDFLGAWKVTLSFNGNTSESVLTFAMGDDGKLTGTWEGGRGGSSDLQDVAFADGKITFTRSFGGGRAGGGGGRPGGGGGGIKNEVSLVDGKLVGKMETPRGTTEFTGVRDDT